MARESRSLGTVVRAAISLTIVGVRRSRFAFRINQRRLRFEARRGAGADGIRAAGGVTDRLVALTYDDGPSAANTPELLDILARAGASATFFVVGTEVERHPELVERIVEAGHDVGNHTYSHRDPRNLNEPEFWDEVERGARVVASYIGSKPLFRPPFGKVPRNSAHVCEGLGLRHILWSVDSGDTKRWMSARVVREVVRRVEPGDIILMHDGGPRRQRTIDATREILRELGDRGYRFVTVSELLAGQGAEAAVREQHESDHPSMRLQLDP